MEGVEVGGVECDVFSNIYGTDYATRSLSKTLEQGQKKNAFGDQDIRPGSSKFSREWYWSDPDASLLLNNG